MLFETTPVTNNVRPIEPNKHIVDNDNHVVDEGAHAGAPLQDHTLNESDLGTHTGSPLSMVVRWFKTMSTNEYIHGVNELGWTPFDRKLWQRNYYEHIIRDAVSLQNIAYYIVNNPTQWQEDKFYQPPKML